MCRVMGRQISMKLTDEDEEILNKIVKEFGFVSQSDAIRYAFRLADKYMALQAEAMSKKSLKE